MRVHQDRGYIEGVVVSVVDRAVTAF
jgi:hypothetical protein